MNESIGDIITTIMDGAANDDADALENKILVANAFADQVPQDDFTAPDAVQVVGSVDHTQDSISEALSQF